MKLFKPQANVFIAISYEEAVEYGYKNPADMKNGILQRFYYCGLEFNAIGENEFHVRNKGVFTGQNFIKGKVLLLDSKDDIFIISQEVFDKLYY